MKSFPSRAPAALLQFVKTYNCGVKEASSEATVTTALGSVGFEALKPLSLLVHTRAELILPVAAALLDKLGRNVISCRSEGCSSDPRE